MKKPRESCSICNQLNQNDRPYFYRVISCDECGYERYGPPCARCEDAKKNRRRIVSCSECGYDIRLD